jgi:hypothetical protein
MYDVLIASLLLSSFLFFLCRSLSLYISYSTLSPPLLLQILQSGDACLKYAHFAGLYDDGVKRHIMTNKAIYDHSGKQRKHLFPGGADEYRYYSFIRDNENECFQVNSLLDEIKDEDNISLLSENGAAPNVH